MLAYFACSRSQVLLAKVMMYTGDADYNCMTDQMICNGVTAQD